ncbi:DNA polymerase [Bacillus phage Evoli]|uniref:DNA polymerase II n=3 Tax=Bastillevirus TaxID=1918010 RepID=A0A024B0B3_9CAUD|nr:DNA polymerase [Bacillus phage Hoody T]YP_009035682.1 DNA polymerase [Bacillus phage Evoli]AHZ09885.1 DNA polymerase II [Bacillus phage Evoli]AHZ10470.1 hypothetical protein [Bacillus phage Hoody T]AMW61914.1 hypothetical protein DNAM5_170 [Bacillus phage Vinny]
MNGIADLSKLEGYSELHDTVTVATLRDFAEPVRLEVALFDVIDGAAHVELFSKDEDDGDVVSVVLTEEKVDELIEALQKAKKLKEEL